MVPDENRNEKFSKWRCLRPPKNRKIVRYSLGEEVKSVWGVKGTHFPDLVLMSESRHDRGTLIAEELALSSLEPSGARG